MSQGLFSIGIFLDLTKANDTLNHEVLLEKLSIYGIRGITNLWFESYLTNRRQCVEINQSDLTLEAPVVLHYLKAPTAVKLTAVCFIAF